VVLILKPDFIFGYAGNEEHGYALIIKYIVFLITPLTNAVTILSSRVAM